ncbi:MAG TPA: decaprenyl-phosphate phosphoribosyltransferase [Solirubrobacteraceae bacterium]|nr:decaprenyl-phosphate phosphoribosyltransferase [Solirubrobacteraceae bacterium]
MSLRHATDPAVLPPTKPPPAATAVITPLRPQRSRPRALVALARPRQWIKNALVIAAPGAAGALGHDDVPVRVVVACIAFCLVSGGIYALNDVRDRHEDRRHPRKRFRPVAAGEVEPGEAVAFGAVLMLCGLILSAAITPLLTAVVLGYIALTVSYTWVWRHLPLLDLIALAGGFVLRAVAGGVAAPVTLSRWFILVITFAAIFVAVGKRLAESIRTTTLGHRARAVMRHYSPRRLRLLLSLSGAGALFAYCVWAFALPSVSGIPWRPLTIVPFGICLVRYGRVVRAGKGEAPEEVLMSDRVLAAAGVAWLVLFALGVNAAG